MRAGDGGAHRSGRPSATPRDAPLPPARERPRAGERHGARETGAIGILSPGRNCFGNNGPRRGAPLGTAFGHPLATRPIRPRAKGSGKLEDSRPARPGQSGSFRWDCNASCSSCWPDKEGVCTGQTGLRKEESRFGLAGRSASERRGPQARATGRRRRRRLQPSAPSRKTFPRNKRILQQGRKSKNRSRGPQSIKEQIRPARGLQGGAGPRRLQPSGSCAQAFPQTASVAPTERFCAVLSGHGIRSGSPRGSRAAPPRAERRDCGRRGG